MGVRWHINRVLGKTGFEIARSRKNKNVAGLDWGTPARRALDGRRFGTIIDIGAAHGTPWLYEIDPEAKRALIEPVEEFNNDLQEWVRRGDHLINAAIGEKKSTSLINVDVERPMRSSLYPRATTGQVMQREIDILPLETALEGIELPDPLLIKIDVEGHEWQALVGCKPLLPRTSAVIIEISQDWGYAHGPDLDKISKLLGSHSLWLNRVLTAIVRKDKASTIANVRKVDLLYTRFDD